MADPITINQIISSLGLTGDAAEKKRAELEKLSFDELNRILSGCTHIKENNIGSFSFLGGIETFKGEIFPAAVQNNTENAQPAPSKQKEYTYSQKRELDKFLADFLYRTTNSAYENMEEFNDSVGFIDVQNGINNFKSLLGLETSKQAQERFSTEQTETKELKEAAYSQPGAFKAKFERVFGTAYNYENIENLKKKSDEFINATVMHESYTSLTAGINDINKTILKERNIAAMQKHAVNDTLKMPKPSSEEKFAALLKDFCKGDDRIFSQYMEKLKQKYGTEAKIKENLPEILENLQNRAEQAYKKQLKGVDVEYYQNEYNEACKKAIGRQDAETLAKKYIANAKMQGAFAQVGITIAASLLLPGSGAASGAKAISAARNFTVTASLPAAMDTASAATSKEGFSQEKVELIKEKFINGMIYGGFGRFVSGPLGIAAQNAISKNSSLFSGIVSKTAGAGAETSADVLFDRLVSGISLEESLKSNGTFNFGMMIAGGILTKSPNLAKMSILKNNDGSYSVKMDGEELYKAADENALAGYVLAKGGNVRKLPEWLNESNPNYENIMKLAQSKFLSNSSDETFEFMLDYANKLAQKDPNRLKRLVESGFMDKENKYIDRIVYTQFITDSKNGFWSKNFFKTYGKDMEIKKFGSFNAINKTEVPPGEVCEAGNQLYVNDDGVMKPIKLSREKFLELFDYNRLYQTYQGDIGDCWLVSAINGMMESPNGRAKIYQMFEQDGSDILVKMSGLKQRNLLQELFSSSKVKQDDYCEYTIRFKDGLIYDGEKTQGLRGAAALQMIEQAFALQRLGRNSLVHKQLNENNITEYAQFTNIDKVLGACDGGDQIEFINNIYCYNIKASSSKTQKYDYFIVNSTGEIVGESNVKTAKNYKKCEDILRTFANEPNTLVFASTKQARAYNKVQFANRKEALVDSNNSVYAGHAYTIKGYDETTKTVYYSNPHNNAIILELPLDKFLNLFEDITYVRI